MFGGLEALYVQVRRIQTAGDGNPRTSAAVAVAAILYPTIAAIFVLLTGAPVRPDGPLPAYFRLPPQYLAAFVTSGIVSVWMFDRKRLALDEQFKTMPTVSSLAGQLLMTVAATGLVLLLAFFSSWNPIATLAAFVILMTAGNLVSKRWR